MKPLQQMRVETFYARLKKIFDEQRCDCLFDLGDTTDDRSTIPIPTIDAVMAGLDQFPDHAFNLKLIGNHEQFVRDTSVHVGKLFERKFTVVSGAEVFSLKGDSVVFCAAFPASDTQISDWLSKQAFAYRSVSTKILLGHFQVVGSRMPSGTAVTGVQAKLLRPFNLTLLGHVHRPQEPAPNAHYVGSPFQQNFGEKGEDKRVGVVDTEKATVTWIPLPGFPEYRVCAFDEFINLVRPEEEHRYQVYIRRPEDAEKFYAHPLMNRAEAIYDFQLDPKAQAEAGTARAWTAEDVMQRYVQSAPPSACGINATEEEVLDYGKAIAFGT